MSRSIRVTNTYAYVSMVQYLYGLFNFEYFEQTYQSDMYEIWLPYL